jgi:hypothetical protein
LSNKHRHDIGLQVGEAKGSSGNKRAVWRIGIR